MSMTRFVSLTAVLVLLLTGMVSVASSASFPGRDGKLAFVRANQIYTISATGSGVKQLTTSGKNYRPEWSPNGQRIAYINETAAGAKDIWVMSATGTSKQRVTSLGNVTAAPSWSPDGRWLAFGAGPGTESNDLMRIRSTAPFGAAAKLGGNYYDSWGGPYPDDAIDVDRYLAWSPDGTKIAVYNHRDSHLDDAMYMYTVATGRADSIDAIGGECCGYADWSDLTFGPAGQFGYVTVTYDEFLTNPQPPRVVYPGYVGQPGDTGPAPAPANRRMALVNASSGTAQIFIQNVNGSSRRLLTNGYQPDWQPRP